MALIVFLMEIYLQKVNHKQDRRSYAMGTRNAYRLSVDPKNNYVYWGDVGPDSDKDSLETRGSKGYDELNQARKAGYFGWPLFIGKNYPYHSYDYYTGKSGPSLIRQNR